MEEYSADTVAGIFYRGGAISSCADCCIESFGVHFVSFLYGLSSESSERVDYVRLERETVYYRCNLEKSATQWSESSIFLDELLLPSVKWQKQR